MGICISVRRLTSREEWGDNSGEYFYAGRDEDWFDHTRHSGDKEFAVRHLFRNCEELDQDSGLLRPKDFDKTIEWVNDHIDPAGNRNRLIEALERMRLEENLYFTVSL